jgi:hypothetical protein
MKPSELWRDYETSAGCHFGKENLNFIDLRRNYKSVEDKKEETPFERFKRIATQVVSVPRAEIQKRELKWKNDRKKHETHKRHR